MLNNVFTMVELPDDGGMVKVELLRVPELYDDILLCKMCAFETEGKDTDEPPTKEWMERILNARHSPIRELKFVFRFDGLPSYISTHLARHIHSRPYIQSQRNDRQNKYDRRKAPQDAPVKMIWSMEAEELMIVFNKRLCNKADPATIAVVKGMRELVVQEAPYMKKFAVPMCKYHGYVCHEMKPCGEVLA